MSDALTDPLLAAEAWLRAGRGVALATVINTWGSAPRQAGSQIALRDDGVFAGSVSGGCVEGAVIEAGLAAIRDGNPRLLEFGVQDEQAWTVGLACGGKIQIYVEALSHASLEQVSGVNVARRERRAIVRAVDLASGEIRLIDPARASSPLEKVAADAAEIDRSLVVESEGRSWFLCLYNPPVDLVVVGAVHIAQALTQMAKMTGYDIRVIDPRASFATPERFPGIALKHDFPDEVLANVPLDRRSAVVVLSHDPKIDDPALVAALHSTAFYIGALGSRRTQASRIERLKARGFPPEQLARIHGPIGLAIAAKTPEEIAISIMAEITAILRQSAQSSESATR